MNKNKYQTFALIGIVGIVLLGLAGCSGDSSTQTNSSVVVLDGLYEKPISELGQAEPIATYLAIREYIAAGDIDKASLLTDAPAKFVEQTKKRIERFGNEKFAASYAKSVEHLQVHSVHHDGDQTLMVVDTGQHKAATFFVREGSKFLEIIAPEGASKKLLKAFYAAKGQPNVELGSK